MDIRCRLTFHDWVTVYEDGPRIVQRCRRCRRCRSTMYDLLYGETYWVDGDRWSGDRFLKA